MQEQGSQNRNASSTWKVLFLGMIKPATYMRLPDPIPSGIGYFYRAFSAYCLAPIVLLHIAVVIIETQKPNLFYFEDINPWTVLIAVLAQLVIGPMVIWFFARCMCSGMEVCVHKGRDSRARTLTTGWYVGTTFLCIEFWLIGLGVFFASFRAISSSADPFITAGLVIGILIFLRVALTAYYINTPPLEAKKLKHVLEGFFCGATYFFVAMIVIRFIIRFLLNKFI
jgi:hypothetical protein